MGHRLTGWRVLPVLAALVLAACGGGAPSTPRPTRTPAPSVTPRPTATLRPTTAPAAESDLAGAISPTALPRQPVAPRPTAAPTVSACQPASAAQLARVRTAVETLPKNNGQLTIGSAFVVKSKDFQSVYIIAAKIVGAGFDATTPPAVWAVSGTPEQPGILLSVNAFAREFSGMGDASKTDAAITTATDGVQAATNCAK